MSVARVARTAIKIPKRIERGPTDILKALASTVKYQPMNLDPFLHDDPYLLPTRGHDKKLFSLSRLSGRSTAKFLLNKHPELFYRDDSEPKIRKFLPPEEFREDMDFTVDDLKWCIENKDPVNGVVAYNALVNKSKINLDRELLLQFFEMMCYTNEDPMLDVTEHQKIFFAGDADRLAQQNWRSTGLASKIFNQIKQDVDSARVYSAMIAGLTKYNEHKLAIELFDEFKEFNANLGLYPEAYDRLINSVPNLHSSTESAHEAMSEIIRHMEQHLVVPNLRVFNSILDVYRRFNIDASICKIAIQLIADMKSLNIEPSPFTYNSLISIFVRSREFSKYSNLVDGLMVYISTNEKSLMIRDERDILFLMNAMNAAALRLHNLKLATQVFKLYQRKPSLIANETIRRIFFEIYFQLLITTETTETIMSFYNTYSPSHFTPKEGWESQLYDAKPLTT